MALQQISNSIEQRSPNASLQINGYTDSVGENAYNLKLSQQRAKTIKQWLITNKQISSDRITINGFGENKPIAPNTNLDGSDNAPERQQNRRVEIVVQL